MTIIESENPRSLRTTYPPRPYQELVESIWGNPRMRAHLRWYDDELPHGIVISTITLPRIFLTGKGLYYETMVWIPEDGKVLGTFRRATEFEAYSLHKEMIRRVEDGGFDEHQFVLERHIPRP